MILIIGILAAIALPAFLGQADKAQRREREGGRPQRGLADGGLLRRARDLRRCPDADHPLVAGVSLTVTGGGTGYVVAKMSETGTTFTIARLPAGTRAQLHAARPAAAARRQQLVDGVAASLVERRRQVAAAARRTTTVREPSGPT